jgi:hypothetical protein
VEPRPIIESGSARVLNRCVNERYEPRRLAPNDHEETFHASVVNQPRFVPIGPAANTHPHNLQKDLAADDQSFDIPSDLAAGNETPDAPTRQAVESRPCGAQRNSVGTSYPRDFRDQVVADLPSSSSGDEQAGSTPRQADQRRRKRKKPLAELVRENHTIYNKFMHNKMPKLLRELGISSDESE